MAGYITLEWTYPLSSWSNLSFRWSTFFPCFASDIIPAADFGGNFFALEEWVNNFDDPGGGWWVVFTTPISHRIYGKSPWKMEVSGGWKGKDYDPMELLFWEGQRSGGFCKPRLAEGKTLRWEWFPSYFHHIPRFFLVNPQFFIPIWVQASPGLTWRWTRPVPPLLWPPMRQLTWWWGRCAEV